MKKFIQKLKRFSGRNFTDTLTYIVVFKRKMVEKAFLILVIFSLCFLPLVGTNYDLTKYLPDWAPTKQGIDLMEQEFGYPGSAQVMIKGVTPYEAKLYKEQLEDSLINVFSSLSILISNSMSLNEIMKLWT